MLRDIPQGNYRETIGFGVEGGMSDPQVHRYVTSYLAQQGQNRSIYWDEKLDAWKYPVKAGIDRPDTQEDLDECVKMLPLVVPGLKVVRAKLQNANLRSSVKFGQKYGFVWFTWSREAMWERYEELWKEYGVADERLAYMKCRGTDTWDKQARLPGVAHPTLRYSGFDGFFSAITPYGMSIIDSAFCHRIQFPNAGGPEARTEQRCHVGDEWWFVGTRGDGVEVMKLEIEGSPLDQRTKDNLLGNLGWREENGIADDQRITPWGDPEPTRAMGG